MKHCNRCDQDKPLDEFAYRSKITKARQPYCKACNKTYYQNLYTTSPERRKQVKANVKKQSVAKISYVREQLALTGCSDCGVSDVRVLEFDHLEGVDKINGVGQLARYGASWKRIKEEIAKCEVVCRNCHAIRTHTRSGLLWGLTSTGM